MTETRRFHNGRGSVTSARHFATEALAGQEPALVATAELLVSELASNCVRHTDSDFDLTIVQTADEVTVSATDWGGGEPVQRPQDPSALSGRGLAIIDMMSRSWGVTRAEPAGSGKTVWFALAVVPAADRSTGVSRG